MKKHSTTLICLALTAITLAATGWNVATHTPPADAQTFGSGASAINGIAFIRGAADPTAGGGVACTRPCFYVRTGTDDLYQKNGAGNTAWELKVDSGGAASFTTVTASGDITSSAGNLVATIGDCNAGDDLLAGDDLVVTDDAVVTDAITATNGNITASAGSLVATIGDVSVGDDVLASDAAVITGRTTSAGFTSSIDGTQGTPAYNWSNGTGYGSFLEIAGSRFALASAGTERMYVGSTVHHYVFSSFAGAVNVSGAVTIGAGGYLVLTETTAPGAAGADTVRIYAVVDGGSKTDLTSIFQSGGAQAITGEP